MKKLRFALGLIAISVALTAITLASFSFVRAEENASTPVAGAQPQTKTLNVLTIGNSFSVCLKRYFPQVVRSVPGCDLVLDDIYIGGCSLERHWNNIVTEEADPEKRHFKEFTYRQKLESKPWDIVSVQQASHFSWKKETYFPWIKNLNDYINRYAPTAEVVIQQTWSYRSDDKRLEAWNIDQNSMFDALSNAYADAARQLNLRIIPVGLAVQRARQDQPGGYEPLDPSKFTYPNLPDMNRYFCGAARWSSDHSQIEGDTFHLNRRGDYLQACVWFAVLYGRDAREVTFVPEEITPDDAKFLRETAQKAVEEFQQVKK